jgi:hypothetical protein
VDHEKTPTGGNGLREASLPPVDVVSVISAWDIWSDTRPETAATLGRTSASDLVDAPP